MSRRDGGSSPSSDDLKAPDPSSADRSEHGRRVEWEEASGPDGADVWHADSSLPAAEHLSGIEPADATTGPVGADDDPDETVAEPEPVDDDDLSEALTELPARAGGGSKDARRRSQTIARKQMLRDRRRLIAQGGLPVVLEYERPKHRSDCREGKRPCLYVACRYHLFLDVNPMTGSIKINFPGMEVWQLEETCALDVAERGGITLEEVGDIMNLTRERIRQVEASGLDKLRSGEASLSSFLHGDDIVVGGPATPGHHLLPVLDD